MGRWWSVLLLLSVAWSCHSSSTPTGDVGKPEKCCPCPESAESDLRAAGSGAAPVLAPPVLSAPLARADAADGCTCGLRSADAAAAASAALPQEMRAPWTYLRPEQIKPDPKPLLSPEVGLASSVLETIRDATEEEYREALARDAARNEAKSSDVDLSPDLNSRASDSLVTIIVDPTDKSSSQAEVLGTSDLIGQENLRTPGSLLQQATTGLIGTKLNSRLCSSDDNNVGASEVHSSFAENPLETSKRYLKFSTKPLPRDSFDVSKNIPNFALKTKLRDIQERMNDVFSKERNLQFPRFKLLPVGRDIGKDRNVDGDNCLSPSNLHQNVEERLTKSVDDINTKAKQIHNHLFKMKDVEMIRDDRTGVGSPRQNFLKLPIIKDLVDSVKIFTPNLGDLFRKPSENIEQIESAEDETNLDSSNIEFDSSESGHLGTSIMDTIPNPSSFHEVLTARNNANKENEKSVNMRPKNNIIMDLKDYKYQNKQLRDDSRGENIPENAEIENVKDSERSSKHVNNGLLTNISNFTEETPSLRNHLNNVIGTDGLIRAKSNDDTEEASTMLSSVKNWEPRKEEVLKNPTMSLSHLQKMSDKLLRLSEDGGNSDLNNETEDCDINGAKSRVVGTSKISEKNRNNKGQTNNKPTAKASPLDNSRDMSPEASNSLSRFEIVPKSSNDFNRMTSDSIFDRGIFEMKPKLEEIRMKLKNVLDIPFQEKIARISERYDDIDSNNMKAEGSWPEPSYYYTPKYTYQSPWQYARGGNPAYWSQWTPHQPPARYPVYEKTNLLKGTMEKNAPTNILERAQPTLSLLPSDKLLLPKIEEIEQTLKSHLDDLKQRSNLDTLTALKDSIDTKLNDVFSSMQEKVDSSLDEVKIGSVKIIGSAINSQPNKLLHVLSKGKSSANEKLQALHSGILDRISELNQKILSSSSSGFSPLSRSNNINGKYYIKKPTKSVTLARKILPKNRENNVKTPSREKLSFERINLPQTRKIDKASELINSKFDKTINKPIKAITSKIQPRVQELTKEFNKKLHVDPLTPSKLLKPAFRETLEPFNSATNAKAIGTRMRFPQSKGTELDQLKKSIKMKVDSLHSPSEIFSEISKKSSQFLKGTKVNIPNFDLSKLGLPKKSHSFKDSELFRNVEDFKSKFSPTSKTDFLQSKNLRESLKPSKPVLKLLNDSKRNLKPVADMFAKASSVSEKFVHFDENTLKENVPYKCKMVCSRGS